jgi:hypothetical protein
MCLSMHKLSRNSRYSAALRGDFCTKLHTHIYQEMWKLLVEMGAMVAQWLRYCATNRKVAGSIPDGVVGIFH